MAMVAVVIGSSLNQPRVGPAAARYFMPKPPFRPRLHLKTEEPTFLRKLFREAAFRRLKTIEQVATRCQARRFSRLDWLLAW
jgi:hypothetical protein